MLHEESGYLGWRARRGLICLFLSILVVGGVFFASLESHNLFPASVSIFQGYTRASLNETRGSSFRDSPSFLPTLELLEESKTLLRISSKFLPNYKNPCWKEAVATNHTRQMVEHWLQEVQDGDQWRLRCLPYFYIAGIPKCGTTDLYESVVLHPDVAAAEKKELHWWGKFRHKVPFEKYVRNFDPAVKSIEQKVIDNVHPVITVDGSPSTVWHLTEKAINEYTNKSTTDLKYVNAHFLRAVQPDARVIITLRNPTDRMYSDYMHFVGQSPKDFHFKMQIAVANMEKCISSKGVKQCAYTCKVHRLNIGLYYVYLKDWLHAFPRDQIYISQLEEYATNRTAHLLKIFQFLGLSPPSEETMSAIEDKRISNKRKEPKRAKGSMMPETRLLLNQFHHKYNVMLADLLGDDKFLWQ